MSTSGFHIFQPPSMMVVANSKVALPFSDPPSLSSLNATYFAAFFTTSSKFKCAQKGTFFANRFPSLRNFVNKKKVGF